MRLEKIDLYGDHRVMLYAYLPHWTTTMGHYPKRTGVVVLPGGAYLMHGGSEGEPVAQAFLAAGYNAYVLKYSVVPHAQFPNATADVCRALKLIRDNGASWNQAPDKLALCGFSAGGHVAATAGTMWNREDIMAASGCQGQEGRPNALILGYPCITVDISGQAEMYGFLKGHRTLEELKEIASAEVYAGDHTPPTFLWNIYGDKLVPVEHSLLFLSALAKHDIPYECHTYMRGDHGCALATPATSLGDTDRENHHVARWFTDCCLWLRELFGTPALDVPQMNINPSTPGRAHMGIPSIHLEQFNAKEEPAL